MIYQMNLQDTPYNLILLGKKTIEMRLYDYRRKPIKVGDYIEFYNVLDNKTLLCEVLNIYLYPNFDELYRHIDKSKLGYNDNEIASPDDMLIYYKKEDIEKYGVVGFEIKVVKGA